MKQKRIGTDEPLSQWDGWFDDEQKTERRSGIIRWRSLSAGNSSIHLFFLKSRRTIRGNIWVRDFAVFVVKSLDDKRIKNRYTSN
ncbi:hypothetical protein HPL003_02330 [Paenibacillus terrae HPL-003]|uniref:Uncharacterized protein n=1 Tax=Paenibacillus terrae (strain HPL-003) TaxID=985665 RepID=G7VZK5_PAETH|nr:hypothetical protein HPL003_02330 [Paenibacillus terrae HPL-003]